MNADFYNIIILEKNTQHKKGPSRNKARSRKSARRAPFQRRDFTRGLSLRI